MFAASSEPLLSLVNLLRSGSLSLSSYLYRLEDLYQRSEPEIQAFLPETDRFDRLQREGATLLEHFPEPLSRPPLFGLPVGVKDIFHVEGMPTRAGSALPAKVLSGRESRIVTSFRNAGALIMGKTVTTEFAYFGPGPTRNPHNIDHTPGGSSSGSAAAVAAGLCPLATGTQTIGSVIRPAAFNGIVGYKPSYDRLPRDGIIPLSPSLDHVGLFGADISGVELVASILCPDWHIAVTDAWPVLGVPEGPYLDHVTEEGRLHFEEVCQKLEKAGCRIKIVPIMPDFTDIVDRHNLILAAEAAQVHAQWFEEFGSLYHGKTIELIRRGRGITVGDLANALPGRQRLRQQLVATMDRHNLNFWISPPATGSAPPGLESTGDPIMNLPWTHSGLPTVCLPAGKNSAGLPMGLQISGRWYEDEALLEWSAKLEPVLRDGI